MIVSRILSSGKNRRRLARRTSGAVVASLFFCFPFFSRHTTVRVPLCPKLAAVSYTPAQPDAIVNKFMAEQAQLRKITIKPLSPFVAEVSGKKSQIKWFVNNYQFMACAFDREQVIADETTYTTCTQYAPSWIDIVQSEKPEDLMLEGTHFVGVCVR